jgi:hypothetical protein
MLKWIKLWHQLVKHLCPRKNVGVLRMLAEDAIKALEEALALVPPGSLENVIQKALKKKLDTIGLKRERLRVSTVDGYGVPDIFVPGIEPPLLIEIKSSGNWRRVAEAGSTLCL